MRASAVRTAVKEDSEMRRTFVLAGIACILLWSVPSDAVVIDFGPGSQTVPLGAAAAVDLVISGLGDFTAPSLGTFDLDVTYDASILLAASVTLAPFLGDAIQGVDISTPGLIDLFVISLLSPVELDALQPESFVLATLSFDTIALGTSALALTQVVAGDAVGADLGAAAGAGSITVTGSGAPVPEPSLTGLLLTGALGLALGRGRSRAGFLRS
jgi:hypothetical protein